MVCLSSHGMYCMPVRNIVIAILREVINERRVQSSEIVKMDELLSSPRKVFFVYDVCMYNSITQHTHTYTNTCVCAYICLRNKCRAV